MFYIERAINNITVNGNEQLRDENNEVMLFESTKEAEDFLLNNGFNIEDLDSVEIKNQD